MTGLLYISTLQQRLMKGLFVVVCLVVLWSNSTNTALCSNGRENMFAQPKHFPQTPFLQPWQRIDSLQTLLQRSFGTERLALLHALTDEYAIQRPQYGLPYAQEAIRLAKASENYPALAQSYYDKGLILWEQGNNDAAQAAYFSGLKIAEEIHDSLLIAKAWFGLASVAHNRNRQEEALQYSRQALDIVVRYEDYALQARILNLMGVSHRERKRLDSALLFFHQSLAVHERHLITQRVYMPLFNIGYTLYFRHQYADASEYIFKALRAALQQGNARVTAESYLTVADIACAEKNFAIALEFCEKGRQLADSLGLKPTLAEAYFAFTEIYRAQGKFREALHYNELYHAVNDSLISVQSSATISELQTLYNAEKREKQIAAELNAKEIVQQRLTLLLVTVAIVAGLLGYLFYTKQRTAEELAASNTAILAQQRIMEEQAQEIELVNSVYHEKNRELEAERERSENLLHSIFPVSIAQRLKSGEQTIAEKFDSVTVLFADIVNFTQLSAHMPPESVVAGLNKIFMRLDELTTQYGLEKIKTIGDAYMIAGGLPVRSQDHCVRVARFALRLLEVVNEEALRSRNRMLKLRIGIHTGEVVAGVIGTTKISYDLWGDTVNTASRMESHGEPGRIHVSEAVYQQLQHQFIFQERGIIDIKGKGMMPTWFLIAERS